MSALSPIATGRNWIELDGGSLGLGSGQSRRVLRNFSGYLNRSSGIYEPAVDVIDLGGSNYRLASRAMVEDLSEPSEWSGQAFGYRYRTESGRAQIYALDVGQSNGCSWAVRQDSRPDRWVSFEMLGADPSGHTPFAAQRAIRFDDPLQGVTQLWLQAREQGPAKVYRWDTSQGYQGFTEWRLRMPEALTATLRPDGSGVIREGAKDLLTIRAPYAWDDQNGDRNGPDPIGSRIPVAVAVQPAGVQGGIRTVVVRFTEDAASLAASSGVGFTDPTATLSSTTAIEDNNLRDFNTENNGGRSVQYGLALVMAFIGRGLYRLNPSAIPAGTYSRLEFFANHKAHASSSVGGTLRFYEMTDTDQDWVEGTADGVAETGSSCWDHKAFHASTPTNWAAGEGTGGGAPGDGTYSNPVLGSWAYTAKSGGADVPFSIAIDESVLPGDATYGLNLLLRAANEGTSGTWITIGYPSEAGANNWYFEIDYTPNASPSYYSLLARRRRRN